MATQQQGTFSPFIPPPPSQATLGPGGISMGPTIPTKVGPVTVSTIPGTIPVGNPLEGTFGVQPAPGFGPPTGGRSSGGVSGIPPSGGTSVPTGMGGFNGATPFASGLGFTPPGLGGISPGLGMGGFGGFGGQPSSVEDLLRQIFMNPAFMMQLFQSQLGGGFGNQMQDQDERRRF